MRRPNAPSAKTKKQKKKTKKNEEQKQGLPSPATFRFHFGRVRVKSRNGAVETNLAFGVGRGARVVLRGKDSQDLDSARTSGRTCPPRAVVPSLYSEENEEGMGSVRRELPGAVLCAFLGKLVPSLSGKLQPGKGETGRPGRFSAHPHPSQSPGGVPRTSPFPPSLLPPPSAAAIAPTVSRLVVCFRL